MTERVMLIYGTRPEAIKMAPVIFELTRSTQLTPVIVLTGQHRSMLEQVNQDFHISPDYDLEIMETGQTLQDITVRCLEGTCELLKADRPDVVLVQGDTTSAFSAALAAFYERIPVAHLEAGLRTGDIYSPYPEEINRRLITRLASLHLAPTPASRENLLRENVAGRSVLVTGNTIIDSLLWIVRQDRPFGNHRLQAIARSGEPILLVTAHRRESWGEPMQLVGHALAEISSRMPELQVVLPAHPNPAVRASLLPLLKGPNVTILEPLPYPEFARLMAISSIVLTDSGGVQEEAPSLGKPVLVMRDSTERPEGILAGTARLVGTSPAAIIDAVETLVSEPDAYQTMAKSVNPYGDGRAARRTVEALAFFLKQGPAPSDFEPSKARSEDQAIDDRSPLGLHAAAF
jgi:UDP-N-acetylglucosamine 2-epimerase (non-hydrolysing)